MTSDITLHLKDIRDLFVEPDPDPFDPHPQYISGLEYVAQVALRAADQRKGARLAIYLPPDQVASGLDAKVKQAVERYCDHQIELNRAELAGERWKGFKALQTGIVVLVIALAVSTFFRNLAILPEFLREVLGEGFLIAGWVSLWFPAEVLLYEWWPNWWQMNTYKTISRMPIEICPEESHA